MKIKGIFFDVDGTLICHDQGRISENTLKALYTLKEKGIRLFLATARHITELKELQIDFPFDGYVLLNGQLCLNAQKQILLANPIEGQDQKQLATLFTTCAFPMVLVEKDRLYINTVTPQVIQAQTAISSKVPPVSSYNNDPFYQCTAFIDEEQAHRLSQTLEDCTITRWNPYGVDIISAQGGKFKGIQAMLAYYDIDVSETMSFGDGQNDMEMLQYTKVGVAMQNADPAVCQVADFVTKSAGEDGIVYALKKYKLI